MVVKSVFVLGPDISSTAVERDETGTAHFDDLKLLHILYESVDLLAVAGSFDTDGFIRKIDDLRAEDICRLNDIGVLLLGVSYLDEKELALDTVFIRKDDDLLDVVELSKL